jgi:hypothetical protein
MRRFWHRQEMFRLLSLMAVTLWGVVAVDSTLQWAIAQGENALIGKLEGPEVITDPAIFPQQFTEAPPLAALVKAGKLPPVAERIGQDPLVIKPVHEIGKYGGIWRRGFTGPADFANGYRCCSGTDHMLFAQFLALCSRSKWSKHFTNSPFLALPAMHGSKAAYKIISACSNAVS